jgi:hypothetical protein
VRAAGGRRVELAGRARALVRGGAGAHAGRPLAHLVRVGLRGGALGRRIVATLLGGRGQGLAVSGLALGLALGLVTGEVLRVALAVGLVLRVEPERRKNRLGGPAGRGPGGSRARHAEA